MSITLKISSGNELRRLTVNPSSTPHLSQVLVQIRKLFPFLEEGLPVPLKYADDEGDMVTVATDADWQEAVKFAGEGGRNLIRLTLGNQPSLQTPLTPSVTSSLSSSITSSISSDFNPPFTASLRETPSTPAAEIAMETSEEPEPPAPFNFESAIMEAHLYPSIPAPVSSSSSSSSSSDSSFASAFASTSAPAPTKPPHHTGVTCDGCNSAIHGIRYKCAECYDFDLCETCEAKGEHPAHHVTLKIRIPTRVEIWHPYAFMRGPPMSSSEEDQRHHPHHRFHHHHGAFPHHRQGRCPRWGNNSCSSETAQTQSQTQSQPQTPQPQAQPQAQPQTPQQESPAEFSNELQLLEDMGFFDRETNLRLLRERRGRIEEVVAKLAHLSFN